MGLGFGAQGFGFRVGVSRHIWGCSGFLKKSGVLCLERGFEGVARNGIYRGDLGFVFYSRAEVLRSSKK